MSSPDGERYSQVKRPHNVRCVLSRFRCNGHCFLLTVYLARIGRIENRLCSVCGHPLQYTSHLILHSPATDSSWRSLLGDSLFLYDLSSRSWGLPGFCGSMVFCHVPIPRKGPGSNNSKLIFALAVTSCNT